MLFSLFFLVQHNFFNIFSSLFWCSIKILLQRFYLLIFILKFKRYRKDRFLLNYLIMNNSITYISCLFGFGKLFALYNQIYMKEVKERKMKKKKIINFSVKKSLKNMETKAKDITWKKISILWISIYIIALRVRVIIYFTWHLSYLFLSAKMRRVSVSYNCISNQ